MRALCASVLAAAVLVAGWTAPVEAATPTTMPDMVKLWVSLASKDFKRVKTNDTYVMFSPFASRTQTAMSSTGLDGSGTVFATLPLDLQNAFTKLDTDLQTLKDKQTAFSRLVGDVTTALRQAARSTTPPTIGSSAVLVYAVYAAAADGIISDKERTTINTAATAVTGTSGLDPTIVASLQQAVSAFLAGSGVNKLDLVTVKNDFTAITSIVKLLK